jgi:hypothetical protein
MYAVKCYDARDIELPETDYFDTFDEACVFADEMAEYYLVDIVMPNGKIICAN